jgi:hypothetical protein
MKYFHVGTVPLSNVRHGASADDLEPRRLHFLGWALEFRELPGQLCAVPGTRA